MIPPELRNQVLQRRGLMALRACCTPDAPPTMKLGARSVTACSKNLPTRRSVGEAVPIADRGTYRDRDCHGPKDGLGPFASKISSISCSGQKRGPSSSPTFFLSRSPSTDHKGRRNTEIRSGGRYSSSRDHGNSGHRRRRQKDDSRESHRRANYCGAASRDEVARAQGEPAHFDEAARNRNHEALHREKSSPWLAIAPL